MQPLLYNPLAFYDALIKHFQVSDGIPFLGSWPVVIYGCLNISKCKISVIYVYPPSEIIWSKEGAYKM